MMALMQCTCSPDVRVCAACQAWNEAHGQRRSSASNLRMTRETIAAQTILHTEALELAITENDPSDVRYHRVCLLRLRRRGALLDRLGLVAQEEPA